MSWLQDPNDQRDSVEVIDWASRQPWSDGNIGMSGISYSAINQLQAAQQNPPALKAIFPVEGSTDMLRDTLATGGGVGIGFATMFLAGVNITKWLPDLAAIARGQFDWKWLADRVASPITFARPHRKVHRAGAGPARRRGRS